LKLVGKSYGSGAIKVEPRSLERLAIPEHVIEKFGLIKKSQKSAQTRLFEEAA
jgi:adenine-specific DNA-methyltransferase